MKDCGSYSNGGRSMKKILSGILLLSMVMSLVACGGGNNETTAPTESKAADETTKDESTSEEGQGDGATETFVIGGLGPLTGPAASYGTSVKQGMQIAIDEINAAGGVTVGGTTYKFEMNFADDEASTDVAITAYNKLFDDGINALVGAVTTDAQLSIMEQTYEDGIFQITPSASGADCVKFDNAFRLCFTDPLQGETMADYIFNELGISKVAVMYNNSDTYSTGIKDAFEPKFAEYGGEVVVSEAFAANDVDFSTQLSKIKSSGAEAIFVPSYYQEASNITKQAFEMELGLPFFGSDGWDGILATVANPEYVEGAVFLSPFLASDPSVADFVAAYEEAFGSIPDQFAADGYDCVYVIKAAIEKAGSIESAAMIAAMTEIEVEGMTGTISFGPDGEPNKSAKFVVIQGGEYTAK